MKIKRIRVFFIIVQLFLQHNIFVEAKMQEQRYDVFAKNQNAEWMLEGNPNARLKALGGTGVALKDNPFGLFVNPASVVYPPHGRFSVFYGNLLDGVHFGYMEYVYPFSTWGSIGAGVETKIKDNSNYNQNYSFGFAVKFLKGFSLGVNAKAIMKTFKNEYVQDFGIDSGIHIAPFKWLNIGIKGENLKVPSLKYESLNITESFTRNFHAGISLFHRKYFNIVADLHAYDLEEKLGDKILKSSYGIEIYPDPAFAVRGGFKDDNLRSGLGIISKNINFDYAFVTGDKNIVHFFQFIYKFGLSPSRKEKELTEKELSINKETLYFEGLIYLNMGEIAAAKQKVDEYIKKYGVNDKIQGLSKDIQNWLNNMRKEKLGRSEELKREILMNHYQGKFRQARVKLENLKLLAPNYEDVSYLEHILNAADFLEQGKYIEAEKELIEALQIDPDSKEVKALHNRLKEVLKLSVPK